MKVFCKKNCSTSFQKCSTQKNVWSNIRVKLLHNPKKLFPGLLMIPLENTDGWETLAVHGVACIKVRAVKSVVRVHEF